MPPPGWTGTRHRSAACRDGAPEASRMNLHREGRHMESSRPEYTGELLRHFADLRDGTHSDARSRRAKERLFTAAVALLDPHAPGAPEGINTDLALGTGEGPAPSARPPRT